MRGPPGPKIENQPLWKVWIVVEMCEISGVWWKIKEYVGGEWLGGAHVWADTPRNH